MQAALEDLQAQVNILTSNVAPSTGKKPRGTKTDRLKAVVAIHDMISKKNVRAALTAASTMEMVCGPPSDGAAADEPGQLRYLGWVGLCIHLLDTLKTACEDANNSRAKVKSGVANMRPDYMRSFRRALKLAMQDGPPGVIRPIVPEFLVFADKYLGEPSLRNVLANDLWQCTRDILHDESNRAILQPSFIRGWVDDCFQQLTGRGPIHHPSQVATSLAGEVLQILATPTDSYDVLSQSYDNMSATKMLGGHFMYTRICERCCLMLVVADSLLGDSRQKRQARTLQEVAFRTLVITLTDHALDVCDSSALKSIINIACRPLLTCWMERSTHDAAVSLANTLLLITPNDKQLKDGVRGRIRDDLTDVNSSAVLRAGKDVRDEYISTAASCFSFREALEFASADDAVEGHIITWLRVAACIMSGQVLKHGTSVLINPCDVFDQCARAAEVVSQVLKTQNKVRGNSFIEIVYWCCELINCSAGTANRILLAGYVGAKSNNGGSSSYRSYKDTSKWCALYQTLRDVLSSLLLSGRTPGHSRNDGPNTDESLLRTVTLLSSLQLINDSALEITSRTTAASALISSHSLELPFPISRILSSSGGGAGKTVSLLDVELFRNLVARTGFNDEDGTGLRYRLVQALFSLCNQEETDNFTSAIDPNLLVEASATVVGLVYGECGLSESSTSTLLQSPSLPPTLSSLRREMLFFGLSLGSPQIENHGAVLVKRMRDQDMIWTSFLQSSTSQNSSDHVNVDSISGLHESRAIGKQATSSLSRHFAISANLSKKIELEMLSKMTDSFKACCSGTSQRSSGNIEDEDGPERIDDVLSTSDEYQFVDAKLSKRGLRILLFACNYLRVALEHGLLDTAEARDSNQNKASYRFVMIVTQLFSCLGSLNLDIVSEVPELMRACISASCGLAKLMHDESRREDWSSQSSWQIACSSLPNVLTKFASRLVDHMFRKLTSSARNGKKRVRAFADGTLEDPIAPNGNARKRGRINLNNSQFARKRPRYESMVDGSESPGLDRFPDSDDDEFMRDSDQPNQHDSDSEDDFGEESLGRTNHRHGSSADRPKPSAVVREVMAICELLKSIVTQMPVASEVVLECCVSSLKRLSTIEGILDVEERATLFSSLIDPFYIRARQCIWDILFSVGSTPALIEAGKDIVTLGRYWSDLARTSQSYVHHHIDLDAMKRKSFPLLSDLEESRILFLVYSRRFLHDIRILGNQCSTEFTSKSDEVRRVVKGMIDISELFRKQYGFKMPRKSRLAYLNFGSAVILFKNEGLLKDSTLPSSSSEDAMTGMEEKIFLIQKAMCKHLVDAEALVRFVAARAVAKVLSYWQNFELSEVESLLHENLPPLETCKDSSVIFRSSEIESEVREIDEEKNIWGLTEHEYFAKSKLEESFRKVGSKSKSLSCLVALGEISAAREDVIPFFYEQLTSRVSHRRNLITCAYSIIVRICVSLGLESPGRLYQAFSRTILPYLLGPPRSVGILDKFPAAIVLDEDQHRDGALYDWLRTEQSRILPYFLIQETDSSFPLTSKLAYDLGLDTSTLLERNVPAFVTVFPMQFTPGNNERGGKLWGYISDHLDGRINSFLAKHKEEVVSSLLSTTSGHFICRNATKDREYDVENERGFSRNTIHLQPPLYDPLVVASAINHMYCGSPSISIVPKDVLRGSLFAALEDVHTGKRIVEDFSYFVKECRKSNSSLLRCLLSISKTLDPALTCRSVHNRLDAFFCVGLLWLMLGVNILLKPANERLLFYKLISRGFEYVETSCDASWLLLDVQRKLFSTTNHHREFEVHDSDLGLHQEDRDHLMDLEQREERQMYELVSSVTPTLVSVITNNAAVDVCPIREHAQNALRRLLTLCSSENHWNVIVCNGAFPGGRYFKEAKMIYDKAILQTEGGANQSPLSQIFSSLKRFHGVYQQHDKSHSIASSLACLQELRLLLSDSNVLQLSQHLEREVWVQSNGARLQKANLIASSVATLVNLLRDVNGESDKNHPGLRDDLSSAPKSVFHGRLEEQVLRAVADVLNTLGLVQGHSSAFLQTDTRLRSIPPKNQKDKAAEDAITKIDPENYESGSDGIFLSIFWLVDVLRSGHSISAEAALKSLVAILQTQDGRHLFNSQRQHLTAIAELRGSDRKVSSDLITLATQDGFDPRNGDRVKLSKLPQLDKSCLWDLEDFMLRNEGDHESWFRQLCAVLCSRCASSAYQSLAIGCFASYSLCCNVFPYILMDIVRNLSLEDRKQFSNLALEYVLRKPSTPVEILRTFVHALDVLCQIGLGKICESGSTSLIHKTRSESSVYAYLYVLDISYFEATQIALRCGASFSAFRFSSLYIDHKVIGMEANMISDDGDRPRKDGHARDPLIEDTEKSALSKVKPLIREALTQVNQMDCIRAFSSSHNLADSVSSIANIDRDWTVSLSALGVVSHSDTSISGTQDVNLRREQEQFEALVGIGNLSVATTHWDGLLNKIAKGSHFAEEGQSSDNTSIVQKLNDLRYAVAWKLEHWETPSMIPSKIESDISISDHFCGFHHALYRMLHFLKTDRASEIPQALNLARSQLLTNLCRDSSGVSAQSISEASAQLRVFHIIESTGVGSNTRAISTNPNSIESAGWSLGCTPQRAPNSISSPLMQSSNMSIPMNNPVDRLSTDLELVLGGYFGIDDFESRGVVPSKDAFSSSIFTEDLPGVLIRCLGRTDRVAQANATASARILCQDESGAWARSACCLGTDVTALLNKASYIDKIAWKLQQCRLRWAASDDARSRKQALLDVKDIIVKKLGGKRQDSYDNDIGGNSSDAQVKQSLRWEGNGTELSDAGQLAFLRSEACGLAANWSLDMKTHDPMILFDMYLDPGLKATQLNGSQKLSGRAHFAMASFADKQISNIDAYRRSRNYQETMVGVKETEDELVRLKTLKKNRASSGKTPRRRSRLTSEATGAKDKKSEDLDYLINRNTKQVRQDRSRIEKMAVSYKQWQVLACVHFASCLRDGSVHDLRAAFRMIALWFDSGDMRDKITAKLTGQRDGVVSENSLPVRVPVSKLLPPMPQLISRLNYSDQSMFQKTLISTITNVTYKFPLYCLWPLLGLSNITRRSGNEERMSSLYKGDVHKQNAAIEIFRQVEQKLGNTLREMKKVADAYIQLVETKRGGEGDEIDMSRLPLMRLGELKHVVVPTIALPLQPSQEHCQDLPYIERFQRKAKVLCGLSNPMIIKCLGSDGKVYEQLVKGRDDLRGDAVMEQMFTILNSLLERDREASKRNLYIRTYRIIPLSPFTGLTHFVANTKQFKELLVDRGLESRSRSDPPLSVKKSLHERYRPNDMRHHVVFRSASKDYQEHKHNIPRRLAYMRMVWRKFLPVFRYFFVEQWPDAAEWFAHQMNYSRSTAVISIVGFILGLGDRHLSNILVDVKTAEVVHIDFGIAFEQGKLLPCPEHMPFRLTRDLVDGFGVAGVEGVFRKCCEITLSVMRRNKDVLLTVVEVLLHDPMFNWGLTPEEVLREDGKDTANPGRSARGRTSRYEDEIEISSSSQGDDPTNQNPIAADKLKRNESGSREALRALNRIHEKLDGLEGTERLSVEAHVARLVDEAQAFHVIAPVFPGWNPWL